jgi:hypothetical protein
LVAESNEAFVKKAGEIVAKAHILQDLLDKIYRSTKNSIFMIQQKVRTLVNCLEQKVGIACKYFEPKDDAEVQFKFQKSINEIDMFIQMHQVGM